MEFSRSRPPAADGAQLRPGQARSRESLERIAAPAQRAPSAGFSQGQRLVIVTDPERRARRRGDLRGARVHRGRFRRLGQPRAGSVHPDGERGDLPPPLPGAGQDPGRRNGDQLAHPLLVDRRRCDCAAHPPRGDRRGTRRRLPWPRGLHRAEELPGHSRRPAADRHGHGRLRATGRRSGSLKRGWVPRADFAHWEAVRYASGCPCRS